MTTKQERLEQANQVIDIIGFGRAHLILKSGRVAVQWTDNGKVITKVWCRGGSDFYPTFNYADAGWGGTMTGAVAMLVRFVRGQSVLPLETWRYWAGERIKLCRNDAKRTELIAKLVEMNWPDDTVCVLCDGRVVSNYDWWSYKKHGICCWGAPTECVARNGRVWDYDAAEWRA